MVLDAGVLSLVLLAAVLHASWNALVKAGEDKLVMQTLVISVHGYLAMPLLFFLPLPDPASWPYLGLSALIHFVYYAGVIGAYRHGDLSQVYPIARGSAPALVALGAWILAGEALSAAELLGVFTVSLGIVSLTGLPRQLRGQGDGREAKAIGFALLTGATIASYTLADGLGVRESGHALSYILWLFALEAVPLTAFTLWRRRGRVVAAFKPHLKAGVIGSLLSGLAYGIVIWAMSVAPMAHVVALRETSVLIAAIIGTRLLREPFGRKRIAAAAVVAAGAILLETGGL
ncbi:MAG: EamA family transporter [Kiloniellales bacterium]|nr:EamA family transporter [Kiloniellales bacterium]MDJ0983484.1 EamA family transporter [Kiloniellales bacterium]